MTVNANCLYESTAVPTSETTAYTSTGLRTIIDKVSGYASGVVTVTVKLVQSGGTAGSSHVLEKKVFAADETWLFPSIAGHVLDAGDFISVLASGAGANLRISGRKVT